MSHDEPTQTPAQLDGLYTYRARYVKNYDGDTITVVLDLGLNVSRRETLRVYGVNTPEMRGGTADTKAKAREAKAYTADYCAEAVDIAPDSEWPLLVTTHQDKKGKYGRYLGDIRVAGRPGFASLAECLLGAGLADVPDYL